MESSEMRTKMPDWWPLAAFALLVLGFGLGIGYWGLLTTQDAPVTPSLKDLIAQVPSNVDPVKVVDAAEPCKGDDSFCLYAYTTKPEILLQSLHSIVPEQDVGIYKVQVSIVKESGSVGEQGGILP